MEKQENSISFYNHFASTYTKYCKQSTISQDDEMSISTLLQCTPNSVLEFGIGTGRFADMVIQQAPHITYTGVDNSPEMLLLTQDKNYTTYLSDIELFLDNCIEKRVHYDCIIAPYTELHHIPTHKQITLVEKMKQVSDTCLLNCLTKEEELRLCTTEKSHIFLNGQKVTIFTIEKSLRKKYRNLQTPSGVRIFLVISKTNS